MVGRHQLSISRGFLSRFLRTSHFHFTFKLTCLAAQWLSEDGSTGFHSFLDDDDLKLKKLARRFVRCAWEENESSAQSANSIASKKP